MKDLDPRNIYPVITLYQPWATWIMRGWKGIETRTHPRFRSLVGKELLIHAGMRTDDSHYAVQCPFLTKEQILHKPDEMVNGAIIGSVFVWGFSPLNASHSKSALIDCEKTPRFGLFLKDEKKLPEPIYVPGELGIWYYDMDSHSKVRKIKDDQPTLF